jgi:hypothetical protein
MFFGMMSNEVKLQYCLTDKIVGDGFTNIFFHRLIMGEDVTLAFKGA